MRRLFVMIVVLGMSPTAFAAPPGAVKQEFAPTTMSQEEVRFWEGATGKLGEIGVVGDWLSEGDYALGEILQLLFLMKDLVNSARRIEYLRGDDLVKFLNAQRRVRVLVQQHQQELLAMMASPRGWRAESLVGLPIEVRSDSMYFALSDLNLSSLSGFDQFAKLQGRRHLVRRLLSSEADFIKAFRNANYREVLENITELRLKWLESPGLSKALLGLLEEIPQLMPRLKVLHLVDVPRKFSLGGLGSSALGQQLHTLTLEAKSANYDFDPLLQEVGHRGSFKNLTGLHLLSRQGGTVLAQVNVTAAGLEQLRSASFRLTHLTLPRITTGNKASIPANLFEAPCLAGLKELTMNAAGTDPAALITALGKLKKLEVWDISGSKVPVDFWNAVVGSQVYQRLLSLIAQRTSMNGDAAAIIAKDPSESLLFLDVRLNPGIGKDGYAALGKAAFPELTTLGVGHFIRPHHDDDPLTLEEVRQILVDGDGLPELQTIIRQGFHGGVKQFVAVSDSGTPITFIGKVKRLTELPAIVFRDSEGSVRIEADCPGTFSEAG